MMGKKKGKGGDKEGHRSEAILTKVQDFASKLTSLYGERQNDEDEVDDSGLPKRGRVQREHVEMFFDVFGGQAKEQLMVKSLRKVGGGNASALRIFEFERLPMSTATYNEILSFLQDVETLIVKRVHPVGWIKMLEIMFMAAQRWELLQFRSAPAVKDLLKVRDPQKFANLLGTESIFHGRLIQERDKISKRRESFAHIFCVQFEGLLSLGFQSEGESGIRRCQENGSDDGSRFEESIEIAILHSYLKSSLNNDTENWFVPALKRLCNMYHQMKDDLDQPALPSPPPPQEEMEVSVSAEVSTDLNNILHEFSEIPSAGFTPKFRKTIYEICSWPKKMLSVKGRFDLTIKLVDALTAGFSRDEIDGSLTKLQLIVTLLGRWNLLRMNQNKNKGLGEQAIHLAKKLHMSFEAIREEIKRSPNTTKEEQGINQQRQKTLEECNVAWRKSMNHLVEVAVENDNAQFQAHPYQQNPQQLAETRPPAQKRSYEDVDGDGHDDISRNPEKRRKIINDIEQVTEPGIGSSPHSVSTMTRDEEDVAATYAAQLKELKVNSKPVINVLTMMAEDYIRHAPVVVRTIEGHLNTAHANIKLPVLYLIDCIVKNVKVSRVYPDLFAENIVQTFCNVFEKVDENIKMKMHKLRQTWNEVFPQRKLYQLDVQCRTVDKNWPISTNPGDSGHVSPEFTNPANVQSVMTVVNPAQPDINVPLPDPILDTPLTAAQKAEIENKRRELFELQKRKLELEIFKTKALIQTSKPLHEVQCVHQHEKVGEQNDVEPASNVTDDNDDKNRVLVETLICTLKTVRRNDVTFDAIFYQPSKVLEDELKLAKYYDISRHIPVVEALFQWVEKRSVLGNDESSGAEEQLKMIVSIVALATAWNIPLNHKRKIDKDLITNRLCNLYQQQSSTYPAEWTFAFSKIVNQWSETYLKSFEMTVKQLLNQCEERETDLNKILNSILELGDIFVRSVNNNRICHNDMDFCRQLTKHVHSFNIHLVKAEVWTLLGMLATLKDVRNLTMFAECVGFRITWIVKHCRLFSWNKGVDRTTVQCSSTPVPLVETAFNELLYSWKTSIVPHLPQREALKSFYDHIKPHQLRDHVKNLHLPVEAKPFQSFYLISNK